ncbi:uncharacterized protein [Nicotiana sylvestris]|uniref:uncharacterized protein n=1 Tax=Nicotiana sylvestris TaxID=4096 RepID=UPI00388CCAED
MVTPSSYTPASAASPSPLSPPLQVLLQLLALLAGVGTYVFQETRWVGNRAREADRFKLWYSGRVRGKNEVGILFDKDLRELVVEFKRVNDRLMAIKIVMGGCTLNVVSAYVLQVGLEEEVKRCFWEDLVGLVQGIPPLRSLL